MTPGVRLTRQDVQRIRLLRHRDGLAIKEVAERMGVGTQTVRRYAPGRPGKIPNDALRDAFLTSGATASEVARSLGWWCSSGADTSRVRRTLGLREDVTTRAGGVRYRSTRKWIDAETAGLIAEAIGVGPWEVGA